MVGFYLLRVSRVVKGMQIVRIKTCCCCAWSCGGLTDQNQGGITQRRPTNVIPTTRCRFVLSGVHENGVT